MDSKSPLYPLSVALIAKNEESCIARCLQSVAWVDDIVVIDGHSKDRTREIALSFGAKVFTKDFESFPAERQYALERTKHDWVLALDADMELSLELKKEIQKVLNSPSPAQAYLMRCLNVFLDREIRHGTWYDYRFLRLFNKQCGSYNLDCVVLDHFQPGPGSRIRKLRHHLLHYQTETVEEYLRKKTTLFAPLTAEEYDRKGFRITSAKIPVYWILKPIAIFIHKYILKKGFLDGVPGLFIALNAAMAYAEIYAILWDRQRVRAQEKE